MTILDFSETSHFPSRWEGPLLAVADLEASGYRHHPGDKHFSCGVRGLLSGRRTDPSRGSPRAGQGLLPGTLSVSNRRHSCRCHYVSVGPQVPRVGEDRPAGQGFHGLGQDRGALRLRFPRHDQALAAG